MERKYFGPVSHFDGDHEKPFFFTAFDGFMDLKPKIKIFDCPVCYFNLKAITLETMFSEIPIVKRTFVKTILPEGEAKAHLCVRIVQN